ncbi:MAG TPA: glycine oxidase ThiO [Pyrinomonadaceae bacterium]|nr:glycine oxidase ThiO [Pyrinomonadaceae bacterium]
MNTEVLIIGGGVIGLSIARELRLRGVGKITIVDRGTLGLEASWAAAGMLAPNVETDATEEFHRFGVEALNYYSPFAAAIEAETGIDIELDRSGTLCLAFTDAEESKLADSFEQHRTRGIGVEHLSATEVRAIEPAVSHDVRSALLFPNDWQVENRKLVAALIRFAQLNDLEIVEKTEIATLTTDGDRITGAATSAGEFRAGMTIVATGAWTSFIKIGDVPMPFEVRPIRGQMALFETPERKIKRVVYGPGGYIVPRADGRVLIGATVEDVGFDKSTTREGIDELISAAHKIVPGLREFPVAASWAGLRPFVADELPVIGGLPGYSNSLVATAHYRNGILLAPLTGKIVAERAVNGTDSIYFSAFGVERFSTSKNATAN